MSGFFNETNYGRINKMFEMLEGPMAKSAASNKATPEQWAEMLDPLAQLVAKLTEGAAAPVKADTEAAPIPEPKATPSKNPPGSVSAFLEGRDKFQLMDVIYAATTRLDEALTKERDE